MSCDRCKGTKRLTRERDLGMGITEMVVEPCPACVGELRSCSAGHQLITYRGTLCPLCVALAALPKTVDAEALVIAGKAHP